MPGSRQGLEDSHHHSGSRHYGNRRQPALTSRGAVTRRARGPFVSRAPIRRATPLGPYLPEKAVVPTGRGCSFFALENVLC